MLRPGQLGQLRRAIEKRRAALALELRESVARVRDESFGILADEVKGTGDDSAAALLYGVDQAELSRDLRELRELDAAKTRFLSGEYGVCADCGCSMAFDQLSAEPAALRCVACQGVREKTCAEQVRARL